jgi:hypothetical protein
LNIAYIRLPEYKNTLSKKHKGDKNSSNFLLKLNNPKQEID